MFIDSVSKSTSLTVVVSCALIAKEKAENKERARIFLFIFKRIIMSL